MENKKFIVYNSSAFDRSYNKNGTAVSQWAFSLWSSQGVEDVATPRYISNQNGKRDKILSLLPNNCNNTGRCKVIDILSDKFQQETISHFISDPIYSVKGHCFLFVFIGEWSDKNKAYTVKSELRRFNKIHIRSLQVQSKNAGKEITKIKIDGAKDLI